MQAQPEQQIQTAFFGALASYAGPEVVAFAVPNEGRRGRPNAARMKAAGLTAGAADVVALWSGGAVLIEFKSPDGAQSKAQKAFQARAEAAGIPYAVCRSWQDAWQAVERAGAPLSWRLADGVLRRAGSGHAAPRWTGVAE